MKYNKKIVEALGKVLQAALLSKYGIETEQLIELDENVYDEKKYDLAVTNDNF